MANKKSTPHTNNAGTENSAASLGRELIELLQTIRRDTESVRQIVATSRLALAAVNTGETIDISNVLRIHADDSLCTLGDDLTAVIARIQAYEEAVAS